MRAEQPEEVRLLAIDHPNATRCHWAPWILMEIWSVECIECPEPTETDGRLHGVDGTFRKLKLGSEEFTNVDIGVGHHLKSDGAAESSATQLGLDGLEQIVSLILLEDQVGIAGDPEWLMTSHDHAWEQSIEMCCDDLLKCDEPLAIGHHDKARQKIRNLDAGDSCLVGRRIRHLHGEVE